MSLLSFKLPLAAAALAFSSIPALAALTLQLKDYAEVSSHQVKLSDVVIAEAAAELPPFKSLGDLVVATVARVDQPLRIEAKHLVRLVARLQPALAGQIQFAGASAVVVMLPGNRVPDSKIIEAAQSFLQEQLAAREVDFSIQEVAIRPRNMPVPPGPVSLSPRFDKPFHAGSRLRVLIEIRVNGKLVDKVPVDAKVDMRVNAYKLTRRMKAGEELQAADFQKVQLGWAEIETSSPSMLGAEAFKGVRLRKNMDAGSMLRSGDVEATPQVMRAQEIFAEIRTHNLVVEKRVVAESDGRLGQKIKVTDPVSTASFYAKVIAPKRVEVQ